MLYSNNSLSGLVQSIQILTPPIFTRKSDSVLYKFFEGIAQAFKISLIDKINDLYEQNYIMSATSGDLDEMIYSRIKERRYDLELDSEYRERYLKYVFEYNCTEDKLSQIVYDISGEYPNQMLELNNRSAYWGKHNLPLSGQIEKKAYYYNNTKRKTLWGSDDTTTKAYVGYIFLSSRPDTQTLFTLKKVLRENRATGTQIYLIVPELSSNIPPVNINNNYNNEINEIEINWS